MCVGQGGGNWSRVQPLHYVICQRREIVLSVVVYLLVEYRVRFWIKLIGGVKEGVGGVISFCLTWVGK